MAQRRPVFYDLPFRWVMVDIAVAAESGEEVKTTLVLADDDLVFAGFANSSGHWHITEDFYRSGLPDPITKVPIRHNYFDLIGGHWNLSKVPLGKQSAIQAARTFASYSSAMTSVEQLRQAFLWLYVMLTEAMRLRAIRNTFVGRWEEESFIYPGHAEYVVYWGQLSYVLLRWQQSHFQHWPDPGSIVGQSLKDIDVNNPNDALQIDFRGGLPDPVTTIPIAPNYNDQVDHGVLNKLCEVPLGKKPAIEAVRTLASYNSATTTEAELRQAFARIYLMTTEALRFKAIRNTFAGRWEEESFICPDHAEYVWFIGDMLFYALVRWQQNRFEHWPDSDSILDQSLKSINVNNANDALQIVDFLLAASPAMAPPENSSKSPPPPHFILSPLAAHGHLIPMVDLARHLASRGARASLVTTPLNAARLRDVADRAARDGHPLDLVELPFSPSDHDPNLPPDSHNVDKLTNNAQLAPFVNALRHGLAAPFDAYVSSLHPRPSCIISDWCNTWTVDPARRLGIPRLFFHGPSCLYSLCDLNAVAHGLHEQIASSTDHNEAHLVPGVPLRVTVTRSTIPGYYNAPGCEALRDEAIAAMRDADGVVVNTFADIEAQFVACYEAALGKKSVYTVGPLCIDSRDDVAMADLLGDGNGNAADVDDQQRAVAAWLDAQVPGSVVYVSFGSVLRKLPSHLFEVGHGLEESGRPFVWVVKESEAAATPEMRDWLHDFVSRTATRGVVVRGWAPQVAILSHVAVGGFVTHCGWNSMTEALAHGVPVVTWPHFSDQFINEQLAVDVLGVGVRIATSTGRPVMLLNDGSAPVVRGDVARAVSELMDGGEEGEERRRKAKEYGEKARRAMARGGSSYENVTRLIERFVRSGVEEEH
uniref:Glycosyltransferase N-terminal domain-containing protein n=1 Tax=Leersia perrieri TaxID=77586 RepID=A0A0D9VDK0_9ORYZ